jgi:MGT family glycosyltransferase
MTSNPAYPLPPTAHCFHTPIQEPAPGPAPAWVSSLPGKPTVYFTLGTVFNLESGDLLARVLAGLRALPMNVLVTVGRDIDPSELGTQPSHVTVEQFVPQSSVLPHCDLVVSHGGSGSVIGALAHGLPSVLIPIGADQPQNAKRCEDLGVARVLDAVGLTKDGVSAAVEAVRRDPAYRRNAERLRDEIAALPGPSHAVLLLERLAGTLSS